MTSGTVWHSEQHLPRVLNARSFSWSFVELDQSHRLNPIIHLIPNLSADFERSHGILGVFWHIWETWTKDHPSFHRSNGFWPVILMCGLLMAIKIARTKAGTTGSVGDKNPSSTLSWLELEKSLLLVGFLRRKMETSLRAKTLRQQDHHKPIYPPHGRQRWTTPVWISEWSTTTGFSISSASSQDLIKDQAKLKVLPFLCLSKSSCFIDFC